MKYPQIDPNIIEFTLFSFPFSIKWYGMMYLLSYFTIWGLLYTVRHRYHFSTQFLSDMMFYMFIGAICGGRVGYCFFYGFEFLLDDPLWLFEIYKGGMSFHGGLIGCLIAIYYGCRRYKVSFFSFTDVLAIFAPISLAFGRLGNLINAELPGRLSESSWGLYYPCNAIPIWDHQGCSIDGFELMLRHPSALYQLCLEGICLFILLSLSALFFSQRKGVLSAFFLIGYAICRMISEFFRLPDAHIGYIFGVLTMGQLLSFIMLCLGCAILIYGYASNKKVH